MHSSVRPGVSVDSDVATQPWHALPDAVASSATVAGACGLMAPQDVCGGRGTQMYHHRYHTGWRTAQSVQVRDAVLYFCILGRPGLLLRNNLECACMC